mgnify:CR=1 FL=1
MELQLTLVSVIGLQFSDGEVPAYVDQLQTFVFAGEPTGDDRESVIECATEMAMGNLGCSSQFDDDPEEAYLDIDEIFRTGSFNRENSSVVYPEGSISIHWGQRL